MTCILAATRPRSDGGLEDTGARSAAGPPACELPPGAASDVALEDWSLMFGAVLERLGSIFDDPGPTATRNIQNDGETERHRANILECLQDLAQLRTTMTHEIHPPWMPDPEVSAAPSAMARPPVRQK